MPDDTDFDIQISKYYQVQKGPALDFAVVPLTLPPLPPVPKFQFQSRTPPQQSPPPQQAAADQGMHQASVAPAPSPKQQSNGKATSPKLAPQPLQPEKFKSSPPPPPPPPPQAQQSQPAKPAVEVAQEQPRGEAARPKDKERDEGEKPRRPTDNKDSPGCHCNLL